MDKNKKKIGFIGQGWIGRNYADDFEKRGYEVIRYGREEPYIKNENKIKECDIVFIAVPTPTTPEGFDDSILREVMKLVGDKKTAVIKSTILPGTTESIQKDNPNVYVTHSPEFLAERTAGYDAANPNRNIVGIPLENDEYKKAAKDVLDVLPKAPYEITCHSKEAELIKYSGNVFLYKKVIYMNLLYDLADKLGARWEVVRDSVAADPRIGKSHMEPIHESGRGAGGHCFIKDFEAFTDFYKNFVGDEHGINVLESIRNKNVDLLVKSGKDLDLLAGVYGEEVVKSIKS